MTQPAWENPSQRRREHSAGGFQRLVKSEHGSPESAPITYSEDVTTSVPPLELSSFFPSAVPAQPPSDNSNDGSPAGTTMPTTYGENPLDQIVPSVPPLDVSFSSYQTTNASPIAQMAFQDPYESCFASPDTDLSLGSAAFSAPPVDWSSFPLYSSDFPAATSTQTPSYASFDYNSNPHGLPAPSSSGDLSEIDEFVPFSGLGTDVSELPSVSEGSEIDQLRVSSASSFIGMPQTQMLSSNNLESIDIDDFLKSANESTAALEHQLQTSMGMEPKPLTAPNPYAMSQAEDYSHATTTSLPMTTSPTGPIWAPNLFGTGSTIDGNYYPQSWSQ